MKGFMDAHLGKGHLQLVGVVVVHGGVLFFGHAALHGLAGRQHQLAAHFFGHGGAVHVQLQGHLLGVANSRFYRVAHFKVIGAEQVNGAKHIRRLS